MGTGCNPTLASFATNLPLIVRAMRSTVKPRNAKLSGNFEGGCMGAFQADIGWRSNRGWLSLVVAMAVGLMLAAAILSGHSAPTSVVNVRSASLQTAATSNDRSEEHTSELQSRQYLVCRL